MNTAIPQIARQLLRTSRWAPIYCQCRAVASSATLFAGHNKWSKIKHEKGATDAKKTRKRADIGKNLTSLCRLFGEDSPQLFNAVAAAKKADVPKANIDAAIARGLGRSPSGAVLEKLSFEAMVPTSVAILVEVETDSKLTSLQDINKLLKDHKAPATSTKFLFSRVGRVVFAAKPDLPAERMLDQIMVDAIEAGVDDLEVDEEGNVIAWTSPSNVSLVANQIGDKFGLETLNSDMMWIPNEDTMTALDSAGEARKLAELLSALQEFPEVTAIYSNASRGSLSEEEWAAVERNLKL